MSHIEQIKQREEQILYRKVKCKNGRVKYVQCTDPWAYNGLREGWWLVKVTPGSTSIRQCVYPDKAHITAAGRDMEDKLVDIIRKAPEAKPARNIPLNPDQKRDWDWFIKKHGKEFSTLGYPSFCENAEAIVKTLTEY